MEREVGGGIGMGNTCKPMAVSFQCMTKFTTIKKNLIICNTIVPFGKSEVKNGSYTKIELRLHVILLTQEFYLHS